ncbi:MAG: glycosyltransferase family 4 protein [Chitinophagales bacterium]|nr:glycosyltransferase family 4 protein [Chitinophagales bacterium]
MRIAFDAKRAFLNNTGLGQYSRNLLSALFAGYPQHQYHLMTPKMGTLFQPQQGGNIQVHTPQGLYKAVPALWRSNGVRHDLQRLRVDLYHGLSHELPVGLQRTGIRTVVTMHDLIFERYPKQYKPIDVAVYRKKFRYAAAHADVVIAISHQTKSDLMSYYNVPENKIKVCYQSCNPGFAQPVSEEAQKQAREKYGLPQQYLLSVGSVIERKNLLNVCAALHSLKDRLDIPLAVIGTGGDYMKQVKEYITTHGLQDKVLFLSERPGGVSGADMPAIYHGAHAMLYPSVFEGFGIPVLEALWSSLPVITSNVSCMPETGGDAARYIDPQSVEDMAQAIYDVSTSTALRDDMIAKGLVHAQNFTPEVCASAVMDVYRSLV